MRHPAQMHNHETAKYPVAQRIAALVVDWAEELSHLLGRPAEELRRAGLFAGDFPSGSELHIRLVDGSTLTFRSAFAAIRESEQALAVFTEHCGHHLFPLADAQVYRATLASIYPQPDAG